MAAPRLVMRRAFVGCPQYGHRSSKVLFTQKRLSTGGGVFDKADGAGVYERARKLDEATANLSSENTGRVSDAIKHDHAELKEFYDNILGAKDSDSKVRWQNQFTWELARHSIGEELVVYPAMEKHLGTEGKEMADHDREEHLEVTRELTRYLHLKLPSLT